MVTGRRFGAWLCLAGLVVAAVRCGSGQSGAAPAGSGGTGTAEGGPSSGGETGTSGAGGRNPGSGGTSPGNVDASRPAGPPPVMGAPGCGFAAAAFCETFDGPGAVQGRAGELDRKFWSGSRMHGQLSTTHPMAVGMAEIPTCRPGIPSAVWPEQDALVCDPTPDVQSSHLLVGVASQNYGQNSYRIRQPFDFSGRTGKVVFDAAVLPLAPLRAWISFAVTEDPMSVPGYSILGNDEGSVIPRNAVEVHFVNAPGSTGDEMSLRNVHVFRDYVDTVYAPDELPRVPYAEGKLNHYEFSVSETGVDVAVTPWSEDGKAFDAPAFTYHVDAALPFSRGYVVLSVHNHATIKYTHEGDGYPEVVDASLARIDNVAFDGPVVPALREYEVPDSLAPFTDPMELGDPHNPDGKGYDIGWFLNDEKDGPKETLHVAGVDPSGAASARLAFSAWMDGSNGSAVPGTFTFRARLNGGEWREHVLSAEESALFTKNPTTLDPAGNPIGDPHTQGRLAILMDVPVSDLVAGDNTLELVTANVPTSYPPLVCNVDLVLGTE
ncbi:MAG TPA: hypothetical protein VHE30_12150 [Polyangiaceae bacterium]|nr:hypothetical protein [Polyangiaceae bacterium]